MTVKALNSYDDYKFSAISLHNRFLQHGSLRECGTEHAAHQRTCYDELERKRHDDVLRNIGQPDDEQLAPCAGFHAGFQTAYKDITNTIGTTMQQEIVITLRSVLLSGDTK